MHHSKHTDLTQKHRFLALICGLVLILPSLIQLEHVLEGHKHLSCKQSTTHLHEVDHQCDLLAFHLSEMTFFSVAPDFHHDVIINTTALSWGFTVFSDQTANTKTSRGPPGMI